VEIDASLRKKIDHIGFEDAAKERRDADIGTKLTERGKSVWITQLIREPDSFDRQIESRKNLVSEAPIIGRLEDQANDVLVALSQPIGDLPCAPVIKKKKKTHVG
jgi:hypothetical protein